MEPASPAATAGAGARRVGGHVPELDGVRGIAIALVMALHFVNNMVPPTGPIQFAAVKLTNYGLWGVDLFFVLSGFLITGILADTKGQPGYLRNFFARRALRIFPLYYAVLLVLTVLVPVTMLSAIDPELLEVRRLRPWLWTYLTNVHLGGETTFSIPYVSHFWSLAVEEHFYLVWPFVIAALPGRPAMRACVGLGALALVARIAASVVAPDRLWADVITPCRIDALCAGAWFALATRQPDALSHRRARQLLAAGGLGVVGISGLYLLLHRGDAVLLPLRSTALAVFFGAAIHGVARADGLLGLGGLLHQAWLRHLGRYSYGLYVFHGLVAYAMHRAGAPAWFAGRTGWPLVDAAFMITFGVTCSYALALASYHSLEQPFLSLKRYFASTPGWTVTADRSAGGSEILPT